MRWNTLDDALRRGYNGLDGGSSISNFRNEHFTPDGDLRPGIPERYGLTRERLLSLTKDDFTPDGTLKDAGGQDPTSSH
jgi:hypothetical protein